MKRYLIYSILIVTPLTSHSGKAKVNQLPHSNANVPGTLDFLSQPAFHKGPVTFLKDVFNHNKYADYLSDSWQHIFEFLDHINRSTKDKMHVKSVLRIFSNKFKQAQCINAYTVEKALPELLKLLEPHFIVQSERSVSSLKDILFEIQYQNFKAHFPEFKLNPDGFLSSLSQDLEHAAELRRLITVFLEISLNKLIWSPEDQYQTWQNVKAISEHLTSFYQRTIVTDLEDLNSLCITLLERYCFFLDVTSAHLDVSTINKIRKDIQNSEIIMLDLPEQESVLKPKKERLMEHLMDLEAKARARESGMVLH